MSKTYKLIEETARQNGLLSHVTQSLSRQSLTFMVVEKAMHTYAEQMAVEFAEWLNGNCEPTALGYYHQDHLYSTSDLYKLFTQQNQK